MTEMIKPVPTINLDEIHVNSGTYARKLTHVFTTLQNNYNNNPEKALNMFSAGAKSAPKKREKKVKNEVCMGLYEIDKEIYCLKCKANTKNKPTPQILNAGNAIRIDCICDVCKSPKSQFTNMESVNTFKKIK
ncbi:unknown similar to AMEV120 [Adoxophyes honmai entomopoxvirus 'L']|uniref:Uncharacterized protein n=1 Tax=Adoxophyes honmai entomopoxvirus 'L' TaxID=1293540 RepID=A0A916KP55_9POXV|nr:unknown similar to AMEV120 [Adoxophyes honmai entomopoxvirus 'L']CCU55417.1 unknown similar to AMEV120 [Adoxophyes honmai entomopoxvirus 'L']